MMVNDDPEGGSDGGLFDEPAPSDEIPDQLMDASRVVHGLRVVVLNEDDSDEREAVFLGHPPVDAVLDSMRALQEAWRSDAGDVSAQDVTWTCARLLTACPTHSEAVEDCLDCQAELSPTDWRLDWEGGEDREDAPGWFPVVVWIPKPTTTQRGESLELFSATDAETGLGQG